MRHLHEPMHRRRVLGGLGLGSLLAASPAWEVDAARFRLKVRGTVETELSLSLDDPAIIEHLATMTLQP